jgi:hypothetical protein
MPTNIIVSYPVDHLDRSRAFYSALGATVDPVFTGDNAICFVWDDNIYTMVILRDYFATLTDKQVGNAATTAQFQVAFSRDSREEVDALIEAGLAAGGTEHGQAHDDGLWYARDLEDPDGNIVSFNYMAPAVADDSKPAAQPAEV